MSSPHAPTCSSVPRTLKTLLKTEPVRRRSPTAPLMRRSPCHSDADRDTAPAEAARAASTLKTNGAARQYRRGVTGLTSTPAPAIWWTIRISCASTTLLLSYLSTLPNDIPGIVLSLRRRLIVNGSHGTTAPSATACLPTGCETTSLTVRQWHAEYLMARFAAHDFAGRTLRVGGPALSLPPCLPSRIKVEIFDAKMTTFRAKLDKLQGPVT